MTLNLVAISLTLAGVTAGGLTLNPVVLGAISGPGILLEGYLKLKNYNKKIEMTRFAYTSYEKILHKIKSYLRGESYNYENLIHELTLLDDQVTDLCPLVDKYIVKYEKKPKIVLCSST